jgi:hypothetical protein
MHLKGGQPGLDSRGDRSDEISHRDVTERQAAPGQPRNSRLRSISPSPSTDRRHTRVSTFQLALTAVRRATLSRRIRLFAAATISYNLVEVVVALWTGNVADSSALIGFGLDSVIEVAFAVALSWQFSAKDPERREHLTLRVIAISFFVCRRGHIFPDGAPPSSDLACRIYPTPGGYAGGPTVDQVMKALTNHGL